tara:strand:+ start:441 stop:566 length:126 start_codon:yes stop_codon:yes gene_type:complete
MQLKAKNIIENRIPKNNIRLIESEFKIENKMSAKQWLWKRA